MRTFLTDAPLIRLDSALDYESYARIRREKEGIASLIRLRIGCGFSTILASRLTASR